MICCAYCHPSTDIEQVTEYIQTLLSIPTVSSKYIFVLGDVNINLLHYDSHTPTKDFVSLLLSQHFLPYIFHPTRISDQSSTIIDNIFSNVCNLDTKSGNILTQIVDDFPQFSIVSKIGITNKAMSYYQHNYSQFDQGQFLADFNNLTFDYLNDNQSDVNEKFNRFLDDLNKIIGQHAPLKKLSKRDLKLRNKPWINSRTQQMMRIRDKYIKQFRKKSDPATIILYKQCRNRVANDL